MNNQKLLEPQQENIVAVYNHGSAVSNGVELSTEKDTVLTLIGRDGAGNTTFVMTLESEVLPSSSGLGIRKIKLLKEPKLSKSEVVVAVVSNNDDHFAD